MNLKNEFQPIIDWANAKGIITQGNTTKQYVKFQEEAGELAKAILKKDKAQVTDAIGDIVVTLVSLAEQAAIEFNDPDISIESCINDAYNVIKNRTGTSIGGDFIKDAERECEVCDGRGRKLYTVEPCSNCNGTGKIKQ